MFQRLRNNRDFKKSCNVDHDPDKTFIFFVFAYFSDKLHIQLQSIYRQRGQHIQRRISAAEIVHFDPEAAHAKFIHCFDDLIGIIGIGRFRDLQQKFSMIQAVLCSNVLQDICKMGIEHIDSRHIDRHGMSIP